jgi:hydroxymethylglutaryl-CoA lyase
MSFPDIVKVVEVGPRDGLQNEKIFVSTDKKIELINRLADTGLTVIEATSFVSPKWVPQLSDADQVLRGITPRPHITYPVLVPNKTGLDRALASGATSIAVFTTASEQFSMKNTHSSVAESLEQITRIVQAAKQQGLWVRAYLSCVLGCPYEGKVPYEKTAMLAYALDQLGCDEISLGDTIGVGTPHQTKQLIEIVTRYMPIEKVAVHFHDTYGQALANIYAALSLGVAIVDSAVAGLGGCPYANGATGNVATEDVLYMLDGMGVKTGVDLKKLVAVGQFIAGILQRQIQSKVSIAMQATGHLQ